MFQWFSKLINLSSFLTSKWLTLVASLGDAQFHPKLSPKAAIVASYKQVSKLNRVFTSQGVYFKVVKEHRDLGVSYSASLSRPFEIVKNRLNKSKSRLGKIKSIAKINKKAKTIFSTSYLPAATWGHPACGITPTRIVQLERDALDACGLTKSGRCRSTGLVLHYGLMGTPMARLLRDTFFNWCQVVTILVRNG